MAISGKKILLIDDELSFGEIFSILLERENNQLTHFVRVRVQGDDVILMAPDGKETSLDPTCFDFALVDGRIKGGNMNGWDLAPHLVRLGLPFVAISGADSLNDQMIKAGATSAVRKDLLWTQFRDGTFQLSAA
jgi:hypothetical protein